MDKIHFQLSTADGAVCDEMVNYVSVPAENGDLGILADHAPMAVSLREGVVKYKLGSEEHFAAISGGVLSVSKNELIILARSAEKAENIDIARAQASEKRAKQRIGDKQSGNDMLRAEFSLRRALAREKAYYSIHR